MFKKPLLFLAIATITLSLTNCNPTSGGKNPPASLDLYELSFQHDGLNRSALVHIPENYDSSFALPVVLNFHGYGGNAAAHAATTGMTATSDSFQFLLVYPQGSLLGKRSSLEQCAPRSR
jgi:polyhydroxybutyrate depolymerase